MRDAVDNAGSDARSAGRSPRIHLLDDVWLLTIFTILIAAAVPWLAGSLHAQVGSASLALLALGALHLGFTVLATPSASSGSWRSLALRIIHATGVVAIGFIWQYVGGLQNPMFLMVFALPVIGSIFLSRWHPYWTAVLALGVVVISALAQAPDLRPYVGGLVGGEAWLNAVFGTADAAASAGFPGFFAPTSYIVLVLEVFAVALLACAMVSEYLGTIFERLIEHSVAARAEADQSEALWTDIVERLPVPAALVDPDSLRVVAASRTLLRLVDQADAEPVGLPLLELVSFSYADLVQELIAGSDTEDATLTSIRVKGDLHLIGVRVTHVLHRRQRLALVTLEDATEQFCLRTALETSESAMLVIDSGGRIKACNRHAVQLFGGVSIGGTANQLSAQPALGPNWWDPGANRRRKLHVEIASRIYEVTCAATELPGEEDRLFSVSLLPFAAADAADPWSSSHETGARLRTPTPSAG